MSDISLVQTTAPLLANGAFISEVRLIDRAVNITGSVFADVSGTIYIEQGGDGDHWDLSTPHAISAGVGMGIDEPVYDQYLRIRYVNDNADQMTFRLFIDVRDLSGLVQPAPTLPTPGGQFAVLYFDPSRGYRFVGRFDGIDALDALRSAAIESNRNGKYASFDGADAVVALETLRQTADYEPAQF